MLIGYACISKADGSQVLDLQRDALTDAGVKTTNLYEDRASGKKDDRPGLAACLKALRKGDVLVVWKLDRLGRDLRHLVNVVHELTTNGVGFRVLTGQGANIDTTTSSGKLVFGIFAALAEFERELIRERTVAGLAAARARGRSGGRHDTGQAPPGPGGDAKVRIRQSLHSARSSALPSTPSIATSRRMRPRSRSVKAGAKRLMRSGRKRSGGFLDLGPQIIACEGCPAHRTCPLPGTAADPESRD